MATKSTDSASPTVQPKTRPFESMRASRPGIEWTRPARCPEGVLTEEVWVGADPNGLGFEAAIAEWTTRTAPTLEAFEFLHAARLAKRAVPLVVVLHQRDSGQAWIFGPSTELAPLGPRSATEMARLIQAALDEPTATAARKRLLGAREALDLSDIPGFANAGLFATHELRVGVPQRTDWAKACERSRTLLARSLRGPELIQGLGFDSQAIGRNALLLSVASEPPRAVAILLSPSETFDQESNRFAVSAVHQGLDIARQRNVRWLIIARQTQLRLYSTSPDVGVGRKGQAQTYFEVDLALLDDAHAGYLDLALSAAALAPGGSVDQLLASSRDYASELSTRLRNRVYEKVVPTLSVAIATALEEGGTKLDEEGLALAYRLTLRLLFRLLFQAYAEDRGLLPLNRNPRFDAASLKAHARDLAADPEQRQDARSTSLWDGLRQVWRVIDRGDAGWSVPAYDGGLFGSESEVHSEGAQLEKLVLKNDDVGLALAGLLVDETADGGLGPVDFRSLNVREFGTIYEGLLESGLSIAETDLTTDEDDNWRPARKGQPVVVKKGDPYFHTKSGDRKATGSYFTKPFAVEHLLTRALDPTIDTHLVAVKTLLDKGDQTGAARAFFDFRVADLAMGSGHFLVAAIDHIEAKYASFLASSSIPGVTRELFELREAATAALKEAGLEAEIELAELLRRQIARRCIYGLDINPLAVELSRLAIWVHTFVPGLPMSSLDHALVCANSLTGIASIEEAVEILDADRSVKTINDGPTIAKKQQVVGESFIGVAVRLELEKARQLLEDAAALKEATTAESKAVAAAAREARRAAEGAGFLFDAAVAARLGLIDPPAVVFDAEVIKAAGARKEVQETLHTLQPAHFPVLFPEVFLRTRGGFDVVLGNPPWEKVKVEAHQWWGARLPGLFTLPVGERDVAIKRAKKDRPDLAQLYDAQQATVERSSAALRAGPFPGIGRGDVDLYKAFAWRNWLLLRAEGRAGFVAPRSLVSGAGSDVWRERIFDQGQFDDVTLLLNTARWAFDMEPRYNIGLITITRLGVPGKRVSLRGPFASMSEYVDGLSRSPAEFNASDFRTWGTGGAFPILSSGTDGSVYQQFRTHPRMDANVGSWSARAHREFDSTLDKKWFVLGSVPDGHWPLYKGESFDIWNPDTGIYYGGVDPKRVVPHLVQQRLSQSRLRSSVFSEFAQSWRDDQATLPIQGARIAFRRVTRATDSRTVRAALIPPQVALTDLCPYLLFPRGTARDAAYVLGIMCSIPFDWLARRVVEVHLNFHVLDGLPVPRPSEGDPDRRRVIEIAAQLASRDDRFTSWSTSVGSRIRAISQDEHADLEAELDAAVAALYGLSDSQLSHVFETFHRGWDYRDRLKRVLAHRLRSRRRK